MINNIMLNFNHIDLNTLSYNYTFLNYEEIRLLEKLKSKNILPNVATILSLDENKLALDGAFGKAYYFRLKNLKIRTDKELKKINNNGFYYGKLGCDLFISYEIRFFNYSDIDQTIIEDLENYLFRLDEQRQTIALSRWGYNHKKQTLEETAYQYSLTRERIRQIESKINSEFINYLRISPKVLRNYIYEVLQDDLTVKLPSLSSCFEKTKDFYSFIELCCQGAVQKGELIQIFEPEFNQDLLTNYFCNNTSPMSFEIVIGELISSFGYSYEQSIKILNALNELSRIKISGTEIYPLNLGQKEAVAHALVGHENGLPWKDIAKIVNAGGYCATKINETRFTHSYFSDSDYIYGSGRGTYRHLMYLDLSKVDIDSIMENILTYFHLNKISRLHLHDYYYQCSLSSVIEYFSLRYIVKTFGVEYGVFFDGKSGVDSLSTVKNGARFTQKEVILSALNNSNRPMTKQEIADRLRSKSLKHANFYLDLMLNEGSVIRINYMTYSTPDKIFGNMDLTQIIFHLEQFIDNTDQIIESGILEQVINKKLNLSYSKFFYSAVVSKICEKNNWYKHNNLVSSKSFSYQNITEILKSNFNSSLSDKQNIEKIKEIILITDEVLERGIYNLKRNNPG
ncbi:TPA: hypothetical protein F8R88_15345, partial [Legionella pneumophila]|nr:hypothetical protein [Legionella pneumophila]